MACCVECISFVLRFSTRALTRKKESNEFFRTPRAVRIRRLATLSATHPAILTIPASSLQCHPRPVLAPSTLPFCNALEKKRPARWTAPSDLRPGRLKGVFPVRTRDVAKSTSTKSSSSGISLFTQMSTLSLAGDLVARDDSCGARACYTTGAGTPPRTRRQQNER